MSIWKSTVVAVMLVGLSGHVVTGAQRPPSSKWVEFKPGGLMGVAEGYALVYGIANTSKQPLWAMVEFDTEAGERQCEFIKKIEPGVSFLFQCPYMAVVPGQRYPLKLRVYTEDRLTGQVASFEPMFRATEAELAAFEKVRAGLTDAPRVTDKALDEGATSPDLPTSFEPTWFRRLQRGFSLRAYEDSGRLTVATDALVFTAGDKTVRISFSQITSVRLDGMPRDMANNWVVVRFTNDEQKPDGVGFRDGAGLGNGKGTSMMYLTVRRASQK